MDDEALLDLVSRVQELERSSVRYRQGEITDDSPLSVALGGSDTAYAGVKALDSAGLRLADVVAALTFGNDILVLGGLGDGQGGVATGDIKMIAYAAADPGWHLTDGSSQLRTDPVYAGLFAKIGTTYWSADATHFTLPDLVGRFPIGAGTAANPSPAGATAHALGAKGGEETHVLTAAELAEHNHDFVSGEQTFSTTVISMALGGTPLTMVTGPANTTTDGMQGTNGGTGHNNLPQFTVVNFAIKL